MTRFVNRLLNEQLTSHFGLQNQIEQQTINPRVFWVGFLAISLMACALRFWDLSAVPLWRDEAITTGFARLDLWTILTRNIDNHPPLTWVVQHFWHQLNPDPDAARVPAATAGTLTVVIFMLAMKDVAGQRTALFAGLLFALSAGHIHYSQDARMYPFLVLGLTIAAWGGIGHALGHRSRDRTYAALYILGGCIAIYSHISGLIGMAMIGFASLAAGMIGVEARKFAVSWFVRNLVLFVLVLPWLLLIPSALSTFPGLTQTPVITAHWYFRNIAGLPGIDKFGIPFELVILGAAAISIPLAWIGGKRGFATALLGLTVIYPLIIVLLHLRPEQPILSNRTMTPVIIGVAAGAGYALSMLRSKMLGIWIIAFVAAAAFASAAMAIRHTVKLDDFGTAFQYLDEMGYSDAPVVTCTDFCAAAAWEGRRSAQIFAYVGGGLLEYRGPEYWVAAGMSMVKMREATAEQIDAELGGGWLVEGNLEEALRDEPKVAVFNVWCGDEEQQVFDRLAAMGFHQQGAQHRVRGKAASFTIMQDGEARVILFARDESTGR